MLFRSVACASIASKEALYQWTARTGRRIKSSALVANAWHHRSDAFSSIPVAVAVIGARLRPEWFYLDHIATAIVGVLILVAAWEIARPAFVQMLDTGADDTMRKHIEAVAAGVPGVLGFHKLRTRYIGSGLQVDIHILVDPAMTVRAGHAIAGAVEHALESDPAVLDALVHIEPYD